MVLVIASANVKPVLAAETGPVMFIGNAAVVARTWSGARVLRVTHSMLLRTHSVFRVVGRTLLGARSLLRMVRSWLTVLLRWLSGPVLGFAFLVIGFRVLALLMIVLPCVNGCSSAQKQKQCGCGDRDLHVYHLEFPGYPRWPWPTTSVI